MMIVHLSTLTHGGRVLHGRRIDGLGMAIGINGKRLPPGMRTGRSLMGEITTATTATGLRGRQRRVHGMRENIETQRGERYGMNHLGQVEDVMQYVGEVMAEILKEIGAMDQMKTAIRPKKNYQTGPWHLRPRSARRTRLGSRWEKFQKGSPRLLGDLAPRNQVSMRAPNCLLHTRRSSTPGLGNLGWTIGAQSNFGWRQKGRAYPWKLEDPV